MRLQSNFLQRLCLAAGFCLACCLPSVFPSFAEELRWKLKPEQELQYHLQQETQTRVRVSGRDLKSSIQQTIDQSWHVKAADADGVATIGIAFDRVVVKYDTPAGVMQIDTSAKEPGIGDVGGAEAALKALVGPEFVVEMAATGEVRGVIVPDKVKEELEARKLPDPLQTSFTEEGVKSMITQASVRLPDGPIEVGEGWTDEKDNLGLRLKLGYKLLGIESKDDQKLDKIEIVGEVVLDRQPVANVTLKVVAQEMKGAIYFDRVEGRLASMELQEKLAFDVTSGNTTGRQDIQMFVTNRLVLPGQDASPEPDEESGDK